MYATDYDSDVILSWINLTLKLRRETTGFSPPAAHVYAYTGWHYIKELNTAYLAIHLEGQLTGFNPNTIPAIEPNVFYHWGAYLTFANIINRFYADFLLFFCVRDSSENPEAASEDCSV